MSGFNAIGTQAIGTNAIIVDESASLTANSKLSVNDVTSGIATEQASLKANSTTKLIDIGKSTELPKLTATSLLSLSDKGVSTEVSDVTANSNIVATETSKATEIAELTSSSNFDVVDVSNISEVSTLTASSLLNLTDSGISTEVPELTSSSTTSSTDTAKANESPTITANSQFKANESDINVNEIGDVLANSELNVNDNAIGGKVSTLASVGITSLNESGVAKESGAIIADASSEIKKKEKEFPKVSPTVAQLGSTKEVEIKTASQSFDVTVPIIQNDNIDFTVKSSTIREYSHNEELEFSAKKTFSKEIQVKTPIAISNSLQKFVKSDIIVKEYKDKKVETPIIISDSKSIDMDWNKKNTKKVISAI